MKNKFALKSAVCALFAAIICTGCFIRIPLGVVPVVIQDALCILTGSILGGFTAAVPLILFLLAGLIGLPVYSGGTCGLAVWLGPTGGFLAGYLLGALTAGLIAGRPSIAQKKFSAQKVVRVTLAIIAGTVVLYVPGVFWFAKWALDGSKVPSGSSAFAYAAVSCVVPFIPGAVLKIVISIPVSLSVRKILARYLYK